MIWDNCACPADLLAWLEVPWFIREQRLFLQSGLSPGATSCRKPSQPPCQGGPAPLLAPSAIIVRGPLQGGRQASARRRWGTAPSLCSLLLLTVRVYRSKLGPSFWKPSFLLPPTTHSDPASNWLQRPLHPSPVSSSQGTRSQPHGQFIYRALIFPRVASEKALAFQANIPGLGSILKSLGMGLFLKHFIKIVNILCPLSLGFTRLSASIFKCGMNMQTTCLGIKRCDEYMYRGKQYNVAITVTIFSP